MLWIVVGLVLFVLLVIAVVAYLYYARNISTSHIFIVNYNLIYERTGSVSDGLRQAIEVFRARPPFDILNDDDVAHLVTVFSEHPDSLVLARVFQQIDRVGDATALKDRNFVVALAQRTKTSDTSD